MNMGHVIVDIEEMYSAGKSVESISKVTKTSKEFVLDVIKNIQIDELWTQRQEGYDA